MTVFYAKVGDTVGDMTATLTDDQDPPQPVDLSGATVIVRGKYPRGLTVHLSGPATVIDGPGGTVRFDLTAAHTVTPAHHLFDWLVTYADGEKQTFPNVGFDRLIVGAAGTA